MNCGGGHGDVPGAKLGAICPKCFIKTHEQLAEFKALAEENARISNNRAAIIVDLGVKLREANVLIESFVNAAREVSRHHCPNCGSTWFRTPDTRNMGPDDLVVCKQCQGRFPRKEWLYKKLIALLHERH